MYKNWKKQRNQRLVGLTPDFEENRIHFFCKVSAVEENTEWYSIKASLFLISQIMLLNKKKFNNISHICIINFY